MSACALGCLESLPASNRSSPQDSDYLGKTSYWSSKERVIDAGVVHMYVHVSGCMVDNGFHAGILSLLQQ
jgi:hypothetical protein